MKPIKSIRSHPQLPNHFSILFEDGTKNIASKAKIEQLKLSHSVEVEPVLKRQESNTRDKPSLG